MKLYLNKHDRICFFGDSITAAGLWIAEVFDYFCKNYPSLKIGMYNCGIGGAKGCEANIKNRMFRECFNYFPKYVVVMFGMNEFSYPEETLSEINTRYENTLYRITELCNFTGAEPIICSPTPYDEYNDGAEKENIGRDKILESLFHTARAFSKKNGFIFVDMRSLLLENMKERPISDDRVHPSEYGAHLMAISFMQAIDENFRENPDKKFEMSLKNKKRYETEQILREYMFIEYTYTNWKSEYEKTIAERKSLLKEKVTEKSEKWENKILKTYLKNADFIDERRGELVRLTLGMYSRESK